MTRLFFSMTRIRAAAFALGAACLIASTAGAQSPPTDAAPTPSDATPPPTTTPEDITQIMNEALVAIAPYRNDPDYQTVVDLYGPLSDQAFDWVSRWRDANQPGWRDKMIPSPGLLPFPGQVKQSAIDPRVDPNGPNSLHPYGPNGELLDPPLPTVPSQPPIYSGPDESLFDLTTQAGGFYDSAALAALFDSVENDTAALCGR